MAHLQTELQQLLKSISPDAAKKLRSTQVKNVYRDAVMELWPEPAALYILRSTNSCFIDRQKIVDAQGNLGTRVVFGLYLSDSTVRSELDTRTPHLLMKMQERGINADQIQLLSAKMNMRKRRLFPELDETPAGTSAGAGAGTSGTDASNFGADTDGSTTGQQPKKALDEIILETAETSAVIENEGIAQRFSQAMMASMGVASPKAPAAKAPLDQMSGSSMSQSQQLELFKKALIRTIEDVDQCAAVLDHIGGASVRPLKGKQDEEVRTKDSSYRVKLFVREIEAMEQIIRYFDSKLIKNCWRQGLRVVRIEIYPASPFLERQHAFPAQGDPIPLQHYYAQGINPMD